MSVKSPSIKDHETPYKLSFYGALWRRCSMETVLYGENVNCGRNRFNFDFEAYP